MPTRKKQEISEDWFKSLVSEEQEGKLSKGKQISECEDFYVIQLLTNAFRAMIFLHKILILVALWHKQLYVKYYHI